jgi:hypothetical protein
MRKPNPRGGLRVLQWKSLVAVLLTGIATVACSGDPCPGSLPAASASCLNALPANRINDDLSTLCSYGNDPRFDCRPNAECVGNAWMVYDAGCPPLEASCPPTAPSSTQSFPVPCENAELGLDCVYSGSAYTCSALCFSGASQNYWCTSAYGLNAPCPELVPNSGTDCAPEGLACAYDTSCRGFLMSCQSGFWRWTPTICPF